jgi:phage terminase Nu1 subunit (DNA packaging protein)
MDMPSLETSMRKPGQVKFSQSAFARMIGVSQQRVNQYVALGLPVDEQGFIMDPDTSKNWIGENIESRNCDEPVQKERKDQRARLLAAQARKIEAEYDVKFGHMIQASVVREYNTQNALAARAFILSTPSRIRHLLKLTRQQEKLMEQFIDDGLTQLARQSPSFIGVVQPDDINGILKDDIDEEDSEEEISEVVEEVPQDALEPVVDAQDGVQGPSIQMVPELLSESLYDGPRLADGTPMFSQADLDQLRAEGIEP